MLCNEAAICAVFFWNRLAFDLPDTLARYESCLQNFPPPVELSCRYTHRAQSGKIIGRSKLVSMSDTVGVIDLILRERRSLETALGELIAKYNRSSCKNPELARMI